MALTRFTLRQLEACAAVAELHSFSAAAERLGLSAQAVSQLVAELEAVLGFRVFDRSTRRVAVSSAGSGFLPQVQTVLRHVQEAESAAADMRHRAAGIVRIGAPLVLASSVLPAAMRVFQEQRPKVVVRLRDQAVDALVDGVASGDVDLALGPDRSCPPTVLSEPLFDSPWVLWCAPDHALAARPSLRWEELRQVPLVAAGRDHEHSVARMQLGAPPGARIEPVEVVDNISTALGIAAQGLAATLAPAYVGLLANSFGLVQRRVLEPETVRQVCLYRSAERELAPAAQGFAEFLRTYLPQLMVQRLPAAEQGAATGGRSARRSGGG